MPLASDFARNLEALPPLINNKGGSPEQRYLSKAWLAGVVFICSISTTFMLAALYASLDGRTQLATPPEVLNLSELPGINSSNYQEKGNRLALTLPKQTFIDRQQFQFANEERSGDKLLIRHQTFERLHMMLAEKRDNIYKYPKFNILDIFAQDDLNKASASAANNNDKADPKIDFTLSPFPLQNHFTKEDSLSDEEAEEHLHQNLLKLADGLTHYSLIPYYQYKEDKLDLSNQGDIKIIQENLSIAKKDSYLANNISYSEDILPIEQDLSLRDLLRKNNYADGEAQALEQAFTKLAETAAINLQDGEILRLGIEHRGEESHIVRASLYKGFAHIFTLACNDNDIYVAAQAPEMTPILEQALKSGVPIRRISRNLPTVYDAIYRSVLSYNLPQSMARQLVRILATDIDLEGRVPADATLDIFYPLNDDKNAAPDQAKANIVYVSAKFGPLIKKYYRFQSEDGTIGYYNAEGRSAKQFLLRKPVPNGIFRSPFGIRRHPILGYVRMHTGVDWAAPRGSPIIAAGDGIVTKISSGRGYGNHTEIQHANGYMTSYSHQSGFAPGIKKGTHVKQGQIIGYVGSTGLSTGPHCHFEVVVNGTKVDPMRVRIPESKELKNKELAAFKEKRDQIDSLLAEPNLHQTKELTDSEEDDN